MTHNEYTTTHKPEIDRIKRLFQEFMKHESVRQQFLEQYEGRELSDRAVTEDGRVVE